MSLKRFRVLVICSLLFMLNAALLLAADDAINPTGRPKRFEKGKLTAYAVWEEDGVWNLRTAVKTGDKGKVQKIQFSGSVTINGDKLVSGEFQGLEKKPKGKDADFVFLHKDGKGFDFQFTTFSNNVDGLTFKVGPKAESVTFKLLTSGDDDPNHILIGTKGVKPSKGTVTLPVQGSSK